MSLTQRPLFDADLTTSFHPFFRFLDDFNNFSQNTDLQAFTPRFDIQEHKHSFTLHGELPGVEGKDVEIEFTDPQTIHIHGRAERTYESPKEGEEQTGGGKLWRSERKVGEFSRSFTFPQPLDQDRVHANIKNGILTLTVPKIKKHPEAKKITVNSH